jgi:AraC-like DNA-binding protein
MSAEQVIQHFSTKTIPSHVRRDHWMNILRQSLWPVSEWRGIQDFNVELQEAPLGCLTSIQETISAHQSRRTLADVERSADRCYLLFANHRSWQMVHHGHNESLLPGDCMLVDSQGELETSAPSGFRGIILKLPVDWTRSWLSDPERLVGRRIAGDSEWGKVLSPLVSQFNPDFVTTTPLPHGLLVDQLGVSLTLMSDESDAPTAPDLLKKIQDCIRQRFSEPQLTAADVATTIDISPRFLHRVLAADHRTFASELLGARINAALQMLTSPLFAELTTIQIARQAGFLSTAHLGKLVRKRTGCTPAELRRRGE